MVVTNKHRCLACAAIAVTVWLAAQIIPAHASGLDEIQVFVENDFLAGTDRYYSNGRENRDREGE